MPAHRLLLNLLGFFTFKFDNIQEEIMAKIGDNPFGTSMLPSASSGAPDPFIGQHVILRCYSAGVHAGWVESQSGDVVVLKNSRRLFYWSANAGGTGQALNAVATSGVNQSSKLDAPVSLARFTGVIETIITTQASMESIRDFK